MSVRTSAFSTEHMALITASATSLRTAAVLHALGSHAIWTKGMSGRARGEFSSQGFGVVVCQVLSLTMRFLELFCRPSFVPSLP